MAPPVLLWWPNVVCYVRLVLLFCAWTARRTPAVFLALYLLATLLDGLDGWLARRLQQTSRFGAWLDVVVDNVGRGMLWSLVSEWGWLVCALEWCVFACNHGARGARWKDSFGGGPRLVRAVMADGFRTPVGLWVVCGLHGLPVWLYACRGGAVAWRLQAAGTLLLAAGRLLALTAELWCVWTHVRFLTTDRCDDPGS